MYWNCDFCMGLWKKAVLGVFSSIFCHMIRGLGVLLRHKLYMNFCKNSDSEREHILEFCFLHVSLSKAVLGVIVKVFYIVWVLNVLFEHIFYMN